MALVYDDGAVAPLELGNFFFVSWYHPPAPLVRSRDGLLMTIDRRETYFGSHALCHTSISTDHLAAGSDFCVKMQACKDEAGNLIGCAVDGPAGIGKVREHVKGENHVYGCDAPPGSTLWVPKSMLGERGVHRIIAGRRYDLFRGILASEQVAVSADGRTAVRCSPTSSDARREEGPLPRYIGRLNIGGQVYAGYALKIV